MTIAGIVVHELVHATVWVYAGGGGWGRVRFGWNWKALAPFAHYTHPLPVNAYRLGAVAPLLLLGEDALGKERPLGLFSSAGQSIIASRSAMATACVRVSASSFARM